MSDIPADYRTRLAFAELVNRIERQQEEIRKFTKVGADFSGHSTRVGGDQDLIRHGADMAGAMQAGRPAPEHERESFANVTSCLTPRHA
jgi:hypothetical protein